MSNRTPLGMSVGEWKFVKEVNGDLGYNDLLRQGIANGASALSFARKDNNFIDRFVKADDAPFTATATGAWNPTYGCESYVQTNMNVPFMAAIAKQPWTKSGIRVKTANSSTLVTGLAETDALSASTNPTYALMRYGSKQCVTRVDWTSELQILSTRSDDCLTPDQLLKDKAAEHSLGINQAMLANAETQAAAATANYTGTSLFESIDRIISCKAEYDDFKGTHADWFSAWRDAMDINRSSTTTYDAVVVHGDGKLGGTGGMGGEENPAFGTDASLTLEAKDTLLYQCLKNGLKKSNAFWLTGYDTAKRLKQLGELKEVNVTYSVNGVSRLGAKVGDPVLDAMDGIPVVVDQNCPKDRISKLMLVDRSNIFLQLATPTVAIDLSYPAFSNVVSLAQRLGYGKVLLTEGELCATRLNTSGKLCSLKA